jgi:hypothetical protein
MNARVGLSIDSRAFWGNPFHFPDNGLSRFAVLPFFGSPFFFSFGLATACFMVRGGLLISRFRMASNLSWSVVSSGIVFVFHFFTILTEKSTIVGFEAP